MRFISAGAAGLLAATCLIATPALAQQGERLIQVRPPTAERAPSPHQLELSRRYLELMLTDQFEGVIHEMLGEEMANDQSMQGLPDADRRFIVSLTAELTADMVPAMINEMVPVFATVFTEPELEAMVGFFDTPMGREIARKSMAVMPEANRAVMAVLPQMLEKMATRMCQHYGCTPAELQALRRDMRAGAGLTDDAVPSPAPSRSK
ncbi:DUF2059 domain-containing protein [Brevundimonas sp. M20]|uniref:DUF2059 domain-containing protein n=1 Tax=Brevundimonas sp. M20 TaxID=2591463 RepID=UPI001146EBA4|nr:DUF2059 domain-containing protein [Brevundimonas sp. M20]QDH73889.1 DUF2059 domain-containing protein [Brevundimonas sp. M20]